MTIGRKDYPPDWPRPVEFKDLPKWAQEVKVSFRAWEDDYERMKQIFGERKGLTGDLDRKLWARLHHELHSTIELMQNLPYVIPLKPEEQYSESVSMNEKKITIKSRRIPDSQSYYFPTEGVRFGTHAFAKMMGQDECIPANTNFIGFEELYQRFNRGERISVGGFSSLNEVDESQIDRWSKLTTSRPGFDLRDRHKATQEQSKFDGSSLKPNEIEYIVSVLLDQCESEDDRELLEKLRNRLDDLIAEFPIVVADEKELVAGRIKQRIENLTNIIHNSGRARLPHSVDIMHPIYDDERNIKSRYYYLPTDKKLVNAPLKKKHFFSSEMVPDLSKAEDAPEEEWLSVGMLGSMLLRESMTREDVKLVSGR